MKKFKFRYERILKIRKDKVEEIKNKLGKLNYDLSQKEKEMEAVFDQRNEFFKENDILLEKGCSAGELKSINDFSSFYRKSIDKLRNDIRNLNNRIEKVMSELSEAVKEEKIMEKLKEKEYEIYLENIEKAEGKVIEEIVNYSNFKDRR